MLQRRHHKLAKDKVHRLATKECRLGETAGRAKATQITDENSIVISCQNNDLYIRQS